MNIKLSSSELDRTYGIGQKKESDRKPKAVIFKFVSYNTRKQIFQVRNNLKFQTCDRKFNFQESENVERGKRETPF